MFWRKKYNLNDLLQKGELINSVRISALERKNAIVGIVAANKYTTLTIVGNVDSTRMSPSALFFIVASEIIVTDNEEKP